MKPTFIHTWYLQLTVPCCTRLQLIVCVTRDFEVKQSLLSVLQPTNILLGPNFESKLSDFGLSKLIDLGETYASSEVRGTFGYVDPEYQNNRQVKSSGDVYSFGIVLLQILSGKKVVNLNLEKPMPLNKMVRKSTIPFQLYCLSIMFWIWLLVLLINT